MPDAMADLGNVLCSMPAAARTRFLTSRSPEDLRLAEQAWARAATKRSRSDAAEVRSWLRERALELIGPSVDRLAHIIASEDIATTDQLRAIQTVMTMATSGLQSADGGDDAVGDGRDLDREIDVLLAALGAESGDVRAAQ